jgi:hypothetical protein
VRRFIAAFQVLQKAAMNRRTPRNRTPPKSGAKLAILDEWADETIHWIEVIVESGLVRKPCWKSEIRRQ